MADLPLVDPAGAAGMASAEDPQVPTNDALCPATARSAAGYCWQSVAIGGGGFVSGVVFSPSEPNLIYARTDVGGAYRWDEAAARWLPLTDWVAENQVGFLGIESIALDPNEPSRLYLLAGIDYFDGGKTAILSSNDYGRSFVVHEVTAQFKAHGNGPGRQNGERLAVDPNSGAILYVGTRAQGLFRSADRGATWARVPALDVTTTATGNGVAFVLFDAATGVVAGATRTIYVGVSRAAQANLFASHDGGASWAPVPGHPTAQAPQRAALAASGQLIITYGNGAGPGGSDQNPMNQGAIWSLDTQTGTWREITPQVGSRAFSGISVDSSDPSRLVSSTINSYERQPWGFGDRLYVSTNGGVDWTDLIALNRLEMASNGMPWIEQHALHWAGVMEIDPFNPDRAIVTSGNGLFMTSNLSAATSLWAFAAQGIEETVPLDAVSVRGAPLVSAIGDYDGFVHLDPKVSPPAGAHNPRMGTTQGVAMAALATQRVARVGSELYVSADGGQTWQTASRPSTQTGGRLAYAADGSVLLWAAGNSAYRSADQGATWMTVSGLPGASAPAADAVNSSKFYAYDPASGAFYVSTNGGQSFSAGATLPNGGARRIRAAPELEGDVWVALNGDGLTRSVDSGATFQRVAAVGSCRAVGFGAAAPNASFPAVYIWGSAGGGPRGIYRSDDAGASWQRLNDDAHQYGGPGNGEFIIGDANVYGRVFMSTAGRGIVMGEPLRFTAEARLP